MINKTQDQSMVVPLYNNRNKNKDLPEKGSPPGKVRF